MKKRSQRIQSILSPFRVKLLLAFFLCILLPLIILGVILYRVTYRIAADSILNSAIMVDDQLNVQINNRINQAENAADSIQFNMYSLSYAGENLTDILSMFNELRNNIYLYKTTFGFRHIYVFLPEDQLGASEGLYFLPLEQFSEFDLSERELDDLGTNSIWLYHPDVQIPFILSGSDTPEDVIACCRILKNQSTGNLDYAYAILISPYEFSDSFAETFSDSQFTSYLLSKEGQIMAHTDKSKCGGSLDGETLSSITGHKESCYFQNQIHYHKVQLDNGWYHVTEIPEKYIKENTMVLLNTIAATLVITISVTVFVIIMISGNLTKRLRRLSAAMETFRLGKTPPDEMSTLITPAKAPLQYDEIDQLSNTFMNMRSSLNKSMQSILELSLSEERLKYQLLQSQINPHFLYNILGTIKTCQSIGKLDIAEQMITDLTQFYRLSLRKSGDLITIRDELEIARLYLELEKTCHKDALTWEINAEDGIENYLICRFTLQPFLENSILHGYSQENPDIHIVLDVSYGDDDVIITIRDNGIGIPPEKLKELKQTLKEKTVDYEKHFGIGNVNSRISSPSFGNGSVRIDSHLGEGTQIIITFAQMEEQ